MWQIVAAVIVVSVLVWIMSNLFSTKEEDQVEAPSPPRKPPASRPRPSASDIDRFLDEMNRRRRQTAEQQPGPAPTAPRPRRPKPVRPDLPVAVPTATRMPPAVRRPPERRPGRPSQLTAIEVQPVAKAPVQTAGADQIAEAVIVSSLPSALRAAPVNKPRPVSPAMAALLPLLTSGVQLRSALLLHDILGQPRCRRPRGRGAPAVGRPLAP